MSEAFPSSTPSPPPEDIFQGRDPFDDPQNTVVHAANDPPEPVSYSASAALSPSSVAHDGAPAPAAPTRQIAPPRRTDHTYYDYATQTPSPYEYPVTKKSTSNFPAKLHRMISDPANAQAIQWQPHGRGK